MKKKIDMVVLDIAGTTITDNNEVENCFLSAAESTGLKLGSEKILPMMGLSKYYVFETLWREQSPNLSEKLLTEKILYSYNIFKKILEDHYLVSSIHPTPGCIELFRFLKDNNILIALDTGFYRKVTDIILSKLGWDKPMIDCTVCSDEVIAGRPAPYMIFRIMEQCSLLSARRIIKIGDTPSDLQEGKNAGCLYSLAVTNGTHTRAQLDPYENDGLFDDLFSIKEFINTI